MIEAKGTGYARILADGVNSFVWQHVEQKMINHANLQIGAAQGRPIEWYFAESTVADRMREVFEYWDISISITHLPIPR